MKRRPSLLLPACLFYLTIAFSIAPLLAEPEPEKSETTPSVEKMDGDRYRIGDVILDKKSREIRFPAVLNMTQGFLEYLIVHENGKIHESLFKTAISPINLNLAFTLLRYPPSKELYRVSTEPGLYTEEFYEVPEAIKARARIRIDVEYEDGNATKRIPVSDWILHETTAKSMPPSPWVYGGSEFHDGRFVPETSGDIAAIFLSNSALINFPGEDNGSDDVWSVFSKRVPALETKVVIIFAPYLAIPE